MKTNFNNSWRKTVFFAFLILTSITLYNCSNDDDNPGPDPITPGEVEKKFKEGVDELPELDDPDITFEEPDFSAEVFVTKKQALRLLRLNLLWMRSV